MEEREAEEEDEVVKWQRWQRIVRRHSYKETVPTFRIQGFLGNRTMLICTLPNSPKRRAGPLSGLLRNCGPYHLFSYATWIDSLNIHRLLRNTIKAQ